MLRNTHHFDDYEQARQHIRDQIEDYLISEGIITRTRKNFRCLNPDHLDKHPSMSYFREGNRVKCFGCNVSYDIIDLIGIANNLNKSESFKMACDMFNVNWGKREFPTANVSPVFEYSFESNVTDDTIDHPAYHSANQGSAKKKKDYTDQIIGFKRNIDKTVYLLDRGLSQDVIDRFNIGYDPKKSVIVIPYNDENSYYITRSIKGKIYDKPSKIEAGSEPVFNRDALYNQAKRPVFVTEGIIDALSIIEAGGEAIALNGLSYNKILVQHEKETIENILLLTMDNDEAGKKVTVEIKRALATLNIPFLVRDFLGQYKDPNEYLMADRDGFFTAVIDTLQVAQGQLLINEKQTQDRIERLSILCEQMGDLERSAKKDEELGLHESMESYYFTMEQYRAMEKIYLSECLKLPKYITPPRIDTKAAEFKDLEKAKENLLNERYREFGQEIDTSEDY